MTIKVNLNFDVFAFILSNITFGLLEEDGLACALRLL